MQVYIRVRTRKRKPRVLKATLLAALAQQSGLRAALAEPMPSDAGKTLDRILKRNEFQPRGKDTTPEEGFLDPLWDWLDSFLDSFKREQTPEQGDSWLAEILRPIASFLVDCFEFISNTVWLLLPLTMAVAGYFIWKRFYGRVRAEVGDEAQATGRSTSFPSFEQLAESEKSFATLCSLRRSLRNQLEKKHSLSVSSTDRRLHSELPDREALKNAFGEVSLSFERVVLCR